MIIMKCKNLALSMSLLFVANIQAENTHEQLQKCLQADSPDQACLTLIETHCPNKENCSVNLDKVTVVGTRTEVSVKKYPGSVQVLGANELTDSSSLIESLSKVPGVDTGGGHARNIGQQYTIRGFGYGSEDRVIIKMDGVRRSTSLYSNQISTFRTDNDLLRRVEVVKGASSISHGGGAIGGVVGMTTKDAYDFLGGVDNFGVTLKTRYESNNHKNAYLAMYGASEDDRFDFLLYNKRGKTGDLTLSRPALEIAEGVFSDTIDNKEDFNNSFIKLGFTPHHNHRLTLSHFDSSQDTEVTWQTIYHSSYSSVTGPVVGELSQKDTVFKYSGHSDHNDWFNLDVLAYNTESSYFRQLDYDNNGSHVHVDYENMDKRKGINLKNLMHFQTGTVSHRLLMGIDYEIRNEDATYIYNGVPTEFGSMPNEYKDFGFYVQEEMGFFDDRLTLFLGGRYDSFKREVDASSKDYDNDRFSPRLGFAFEVIDGLFMLGNFSESFRAPTPHETSSEGPLNPHYWYLPNPDLEAENAGEYELGFSFTRQGVFLEEDSLWLKAMYFNGTIDNMITFEPQYDLGTSPDDSPYGMYVNVENAKRHGFEFEARYQIGGWQADMTFETLNQYDENSGEKVPFAFADKIRLGGGYLFKDSDIFIGMDVSRWFKPDQNPETYDYFGETLYYVNKPYTIANVKAKWRPYSTGHSWLDGRFELEGGVNNITNQDYLNAMNVTDTSRVGKGRNVYVQMIIDF